MRVFLRVRSFVRNRRLYPPRACKSKDQALTQRVTFATYFELLANASGKTREAPRRNSKRACNSFISLFTLRHERFINASTPSLRVMPVARWTQRIDN